MLLLPRLYAIVDAEQTGSVFDTASNLLSAGVRLIQYRDKRANSRNVFMAASKLAEIIHRASGVFIVNDRFDIALAAGADGVHLGQEDLPAQAARANLPGGKLIGVSTHSVEQIIKADLEPMDYIAFGPIFPTASKRGADPVVGLAGLAEARRATRKPLVAIGGITADNARAVIEAGADSVAVIRDLAGAPDTADRARRLIAELEG